MNKNLEKLHEIAESETSPLFDKVQERRKNRYWLKKSQQIAVRVLMTLREKGMSQKQLAEQLEVSPQQVSKIVKGKQNLTLDTISKLEQVLEIPLIEVSKKEQFVSANQTKMQQFVSHTTKLHNTSVKKPNYNEATVVSKKATKYHKLVA